MIDKIREVSIFVFVILESSGKCETDDETKAVIRMAEEYVGDDG